MASYNSNTAYDISLFEETSPRKTQEIPALGKSGAQKKKSNGRGKVVVITEEKIDRAARRRVNYPRVVLTTLFGGMIAFLLIVNIMGKVTLTELNQQIIDTQQELTEAQSQYTQTELSVNSKYSTATVEQYAREQLNMSRASNESKEFVSLSEGDKAEIIENEDENIFERLVNAIKEILS